MVDKDDTATICRAVTRTLALTQLQQAPVFPRSAKKVLGALIQSADERGVAQMSYPTIAATADLNLRTVIVWVKQLLDGGFLTIIEPASFYRPTSYRVHVDRVLRRLS
jgi:hypothetical protein